MTTTAAPIVEDDDYVPTRLDLARDRLGERIVGLAEHLRMLGERVTGNRAHTDAEEFRLTYDWGYKIGHNNGRDEALTLLVGQGGTR